ncbi:MAG: hypothetical protein AAGC84_01055 [Pseudomonas sp.]
MAATRTPDQIEEAYLAAMGEELGSAFYPLYVDLVELHVVWQQYRQLFGADAETVQVLNRTAGLFFKIVQDELWDSVLLGISRFTDPSGNGSRKNLTIQTLPALIKDSELRLEVESLCVAAVAQAAFAREHRNKRIAHQDHGYSISRSSHPLSGISRELVESMLASLRAVLNRLDLYFRDNTVFYEDFVDESGARVLVHKLQQFERLKDASRAL